MKISKSLVLAICFMLLMCSCTIVKAATDDTAYSCGIALSSSSKLVAGQKVEVTLSLKDVNAGDGVDAFSGTLEFDSNILELTNGAGDISGLNGWSKGAYSATTNKFTATGSSKASTNTAILKFTFTVKQDVTASSTVVSVKNAQTSGGILDEGGTGTLNCADAQVTIKAGEQAAADTATQTPATDTTTTTTTSTSAKKITKLPQTGVGYLEIATGFVVLAGIAVVTFRRYNKLNNIK